MDISIGKQSSVSPSIFQSRLALVLKGIAVATIVAVIGIVALLVSIRQERRTEVTLPTPTGTFAVGRATYAWSDDSRFDTLAPVQRTKRELVVWIWYPAAVQSPAVIDDYLPAPWRVALEGQSNPIMKFLTRDLSLVHAHSARNANVATQQRSYPVVILRGGASANVTNYTTLAEDLASHGYVVVGIDAPYRTSVVVFPDGRVIPRTPENNPELFSGDEFIRVATKLLGAWTADIGFVLDQLERLNVSDPSGRFTGRLDMKRVGVIGHSFGGAQAAQFCHEDSRCKAGIDLDGAPFGSVIQSGLHQPFMFLFSGLGDFSSGAEVGPIMSDIQSIYDHLPPDGRFIIGIRGANHFTFSDDGALLKSRVVRGALSLFGRLRIDGRRQLAVTAYCVHRFFDTYLKGAGDSRLEISSSLYPELQVHE